LIVTQAATGETMCQASHAFCMMLQTHKKTFVNETQLERKTRSVAKAKTMREKHEKSEWKIHL
jgi:hypothetical protein